MERSCNPCTICPRKCQINRSEKSGFCNESNKLRVAKIIENFEWEEPCITGRKGTLAIFFSGCNLRCDYCQNFEISRGQTGTEYSIEEFAQLIENLQDNHCSIDLITPTHFSWQLSEAFKKVEKRVPVIWNTNSYETIENIKLVSEFVDVFLADLKYSNDELGRKFSACNNYLSCALPAICKMRQLKPDLYEADFLKQGLIIRHLVLPANVSNSIEVLDIIKKHFPNTLISLMSQFTPNGRSNLNRKLKPIEYKAVVSHLEKLNLTQGYVQEFESADEQFIPDFK